MGRLSLDNWPGVNLWRNRNELSTLVSVESLFLLQQRLKPCHLSKDNGHIVLPLFLMVGPKIFSVMFTSVVVVVGVDLWRTDLTNPPCTEEWASSQILLKKFSNFGCKTK